jgi:outer membrane protein insertion porin family
MSAFVDTGWTGNNFKLDDLRASAGIGALWVSPMGPLKISIAIPFRYDRTDKKQIFQFTFGGAF